MDDPGYQIVVILVLLVLSAFFSSTETALLVLGQAKIHHLIQVENRRIRLLGLWQTRPTDILSAILIGNNLVNVLASALAGRFAAHAVKGAGFSQASTLGLGIAVGVMTFLIVTFGEILPKNFARRSPMTLLTLSPLMMVFLYPLLPFAMCFRWLQNKLLGGESVADATPQLTEAEVEAMIKLGAERGVITGEKRKLFASIMEFSDTMAKEIMVPRTDVVAFPVDAQLEEVLNTVNERRFSRYPVYQKTIDTVVGILTVKDLLRFLASCEDPAQGFSLRRLLSPKVLIVPETKKIGQVLKDCQKQKIQLAIVVDEFGGTAGIVTAEDIVEEIVGEIYEEYEREAEDFTKLEGGRYEVRGSARVEMLEELFGIELPEQDNYETVGGLVMTQAGKVPMVGEKVDYGELEFEVKERTRTRILSVVVGKKDTDTGEDWK